MAVEFLFLADMQLGCYASFSGLTPTEVEEYATKDLIVRSVPPVDDFEWDARQYERAVEAVNAIGPDFVLVGGDLIDDANRDDQIETFLEITARIDDDIPVRFAPGNHDIAPDSVVPTAESIASYREVFGDDYYRFSFGPLQVVVLNTVVLDHPELVPDELDAQLSFLESSLADPLPGTEMSVLAGHHPLFVSAPDEEETYWNLPLARRRRVLDAVRRHGVRAAFAGHWHRNAVARVDGFEMVTTGPVGYPLGFDPSGFRRVAVADGEISHRYIALDGADAQHLRQT
jgi:3',5'-cyclic AMP phosphodiesterase CpdA